MINLQLKRAYEPESPEDGFRVYVDRLWPRGLSHETFHYDLWYKEIAPSNELRHWFHEDPQNRWQEFENKYIEELKVNPATPKLWQTLQGHATATLLYSSKDPGRNNADVLRDYLIANFQ